MKSLSSHNSTSLWQKCHASERTKASLVVARAQGRVGGRPSKLTPEQVRQAEAMLRDTTSYPFISDVIGSLPIGRTAIYNHFTPDRIREL